MMTSCELAFIGISSKKYGKRTLCLKLTFWGFTLSKDFIYWVSRMSGLNSSITSIQEYTA